MYFKNPSWIGFLDASFGSDGALSWRHSWWAWPGRARGEWWVISKQRVSCISNCQKQCRCEGHQCLSGLHAKSDTKLLRDIPECWHHSGWILATSAATFWNPSGTAPGYLMVISMGFSMIMCNILGCSHCTLDIENTARPSSSLKLHAFEALTLLSYFHSSPSSFLSSKHFLF